MNHGYPLGRKAILEAGVQWITDTIKLVAVTASYVQSDAHQFLSDIASGTRVATATLTSKTTTGGVARAATTTFPTVAAGPAITGLAVYKDTGTESTSALIYWFDTKSDSSAISVTPDGTDINVVWPSAGVFR